MADKEFVGFGKLPDNIKALARRYNCVDGDGIVTMDAALDAGGCVIYGKDKLKEIGGVSIGEHNWERPAILILDGRKAYGIEDDPAKNQDGTDLELFGDIIRWARLAEQKDAETCSAVLIIYEQFVSYLAALNFIGTGTDAQVRNRRGRIQRAKLTACRIWREGALKKVAPAEPIVEPT